MARARRNDLPAHLIKIHYLLYTMNRDNNAPESAPEEEKDESAGGKGGGYDEEKKKGGNAFPW